MEDLSKSKKTIIIPNVLLAVNALLHFISSGLILNWGTYLDIRNQQSSHSENYYSRLPIAQYLIIIGIYLLFSACLSMITHLLQGQKTFIIALICWYGTLFGLAFNFASGVFLMIWVSFNNRLFNHNNYIFANQPLQYKSMYITIAFDAIFTLVLGSICSIILLIQDNYSLARCKINENIQSLFDRSPSQLPSISM